MTVAEALSDLAARTAAETAVDPGKLAEVEKLLGEAAAARMLNRLRGDIAERLSDGRIASAEKLAIAADAHAMVSSTGFLGFVALSRACSSLERACRQDLALDDALAEATFERDRALALLGSLSAAA